MFNFDKIIRNIQKPITYVGGEINCFHPDTENSEIKFALGYPDLYEVGMSNLGVRILYHILNNLDGVACERFFAPGYDLENILRKTDTPFFTLESRRPLKEFDIIGFSISSELNYTNLINLLSLSKIPLHSVERDESDLLFLLAGTAHFTLNLYLTLLICGLLVKQKRQLLNLLRHTEILKD